jgi:cytidylate kinase
MREGDADIRKLVITIDGPAGAGKSTAARMLARSLGYKYIDTGAIYRTVALRATLEGIPLEDEEALSRLCARISIDFRFQDDELKVLCDGEDVSGLIRGTEAGMKASTVSAHPMVRKELLLLQRRLGEGGGIVAEGRDVGTVVYPQADIKFYLEASPEARGRRCYNDDRENGGKFELEEIIDMIKKRDQQDSTRTVAPLKVPEDAFMIDNTELNAQETLELILSLMEKRFPDIVSQHK